MDVTSTPIVFRRGFVARLLGIAGGDSMTLGPKGVSDGTAPAIPYKSIAAVRFRRGRIWGSVILDATGGDGGEGDSCLRIDGFTNRGAERLAGVLSARVVLSAHGGELRRLSAWAASHDELAAGARYVSRWELERWIDAWRDAAAWESDHRHLIAGGLPDLAARLQAVVRFWAGPFAGIRPHNGRFARGEIEKHAALFDDINGRSLTPQQRDIAVRNETDVLVVAGAGTGKTQAIAGKVAYLVRSGLAHPEEILIVAFNTKAAEELRERCGRACGRAAGGGGGEIDGGAAGRGGGGVQARTFHSLGNKILGSPPLLDGAGDEGRMPGLVEELVRPLRDDPAFESDLAELILLYREPLIPTVSCHDFAEYSRMVKASSLRTLRGGPRVKNGEELRIADWLFLHGVEYQYDHPLPPPKERPERAANAERAAKATFHLPRWEIWLAHRALDSRGVAPAWLRDRERIATEIARERALHRTLGARLVESYSWWFAEDGAGGSAGRGADDSAAGGAEDGAGMGWEARLRRALTEAGATVPEIEWAPVMAGLLETDRRAAVDRGLRWFYASAARYIQLLSEGGHRPEDVFAAAPRFPDARRIRLFKRLCRPVWQAYQRRKEEEGRIDFSDMIGRSRAALAEGKWRQRFTHIIVDEYQDVSRSKLELLLELRALTPGSSLTCVGDDWQAINRFAGGDVGLMTGFESHVGGKPWETHLDSTFRFNRNIAEVSGWFVQNNPRQIRKSLGSNLPLEGDEIVVLHAPHASADDLSPVLLALDDIERRARPGATVCILSRYRRLLGDGDAIVASMGKRYRNLKISVSTVHKYKGKEADWIVAGWLTDERSGFPCMRLDDPIMAELLPDSEQFPFAEERRLFYVALTRARRGVYLVCDLAKPSPFVVELEREWAGRKRIKVVNLGHAPNRLCPACAEGALVPRSGVHGLFYACQNAPACTYREPSCPACGTGMMLVEGTMLTCSDSNCRHQVRKCPQCGTGRLTERTNSATGERFWGCSMYADSRVRCRFTAASP